MRFYHSGTPRNDKYQDYEDSLCLHRLFSLHGDYYKAVKKWVQRLPTSREIRPYPETLLLDSGAFTAWNAGTPAELGHVIDSYEGILEEIDKVGASFKEVWMINLDKIPGERGRTATTQEMLDAFKESDENFAVLNEKFNKRILPVFHQNEENIAPERLAIVADQSKYICLSPRNDLGEKLRHSWSLKMHKLLNEQRPGINTHGLATTGNNMIRDVPWFSVDSAAWVLHGGMAGKVDFYYKFDARGEKPIYRNFFFALEGGKQYGGNHHYKTVTKGERAWMDERIAEYSYYDPSLQETVTFTPELLMKDSRARSLVCMGELSRFFDAAVAKRKEIPVQDDLYGF